MKTTNKDYVVYDKATGRQISRVFFRRHYCGMYNKFMTGFQAAIDYKRSMDRFYKLYPENFTILNLAIRVRTTKDH